MESLSYLIENYNKVRIDQALLRQNLAKGNAVNMNIANLNNKNKSPLSKNNGNTLINRKYSPIAKQNIIKYNNGSQNTVKTNKIGSPTQTKVVFVNKRKQTVGKNQHLREIRNQIENLEYKHKNMEANYTQSFFQIYHEINKNNQQDKIKNQEFTKVKLEILNTKKDLAYLIKLLHHRKTHKSQTNHIQVKQQIEKFNSYKSKEKSQIPLSPNNRIKSLIGR